MRSANAGRMAGTFAPTEETPMTRRDFQMICRVLKATHAPARVVEALAAELRTTNPRFDHSRFLTSAGVA